MFDSGKFWLSALTLTPRHGTLSGLWWSAMRLCGCLPTQSTSRWCRGSRQQRHSDRQSRMSNSTSYLNFNTLNLCNAIFRKVKQDQYMHTRQTNDIIGTLPFVNESSKLWQRSAVFLLWLFSCRALLLNAPGMLFIITLCCATGVVMYAYYEQCDPLKAEIVDDPNQVSAHSHHPVTAYKLTGLGNYFLAININSPDQ